MTYGCGKSDSAILAGKPTNKAEQSAAESVERRVEAKGNTGQQSTYRAQDRESVSQALDRIRQVARHRKKEKFTALFHHITVQLLREAFFELKENAAPGADGLRWGEYEADLEHRLEDLARTTPAGSVSGAAGPARVHTQVRRAAAPARGCRPGRQNRPEGDCRSAKRDL
jgi:RNA-directed DNA polymerase